MEKSISKYLQINIQNNYIGLEKYSKNNDIHSFVFV
jgi:hypothetical protein